jgi:hypothetical protein
MALTAQQNLSKKPNVLVVRLVQVILETLTLIHLAQLVMLANIPQSEWTVAKSAQRVTYV